VDAAHGYGWKEALRIEGTLSGTGEIDVDFSAYSAKIGYECYGFASVTSNATVSSGMSGVAAQTGSENAYYQWVSTDYMFAGGRFGNFQAMTSLLPSAPDLQTLIDNFAASAPMVYIHIENYADEQTIDVPSLTIPENAELSLYNGGVGIDVAADTEIIVNGRLWTDRSYDESGGAIDFITKLSKTVRRGAAGEPLTQLHLSNGEFDIAEDLTIDNLQLSFAQVTVSGQLTVNRQSWIDDRPQRDLAIENGRPSTMTVAPGGQLTYRIGKTWDQAAQEYTDWDTFVISDPGEYWLLNSKWYKVGEPAETESLQLNASGTNSLAGRSVITRYFGVYGGNGAVQLDGTVVLTGAGISINLQENTDLTIGQSGSLSGLDYIAAGSVLPADAFFPYGRTAADFYYKYKNNNTTLDPSSNVSVRVNYSPSGQSVSAYIGAKVTLTAGGQAPWLYYFDNADDANANMAPTVAGAGTYIMTAVNNEYACWIKQ
jgi:hypothetical protein